MSPLDQAAGRARAPGVTEHRAFSTTRWSMVLQAGGTASPGGRRAMEQLCQTYWYPLYGFARYRGQSPQDAEDATQGFFAALLENGVLQHADRERGRFRTFLLTAFRNFQINEHARATALKRGGTEGAVHFDALEAEARYRLEPVTNESPDRVFDRRWASGLLERVTQLLRREYAAADRVAWFDHLKVVLWGGRGELSYGVIARELGATEGAVKVAMHRLRRRFRDVLLAEIANTVASPDDVEDELRHLLGALSR